MISELWEKKIGLRYKAWAKRKSTYMHSYQQVTTYRNIVLKILLVAQQLALIDPPQRLRRKLTLWCQERRSNHASCRGIYWLKTEAILSRKLLSRQRNRAFSKHGRNCKPDLDALGINYKASFNPDQRTLYSKGRCRTASFCSKTA